MMTSKGFKKFIQILRERKEPTDKQLADAWLYLAHDPVETVPRLLRDYTAQWLTDRRWEKKNDL